jgi:hypothetical protein
VSNPIRQQLRNLIGVASHLDGLLCENGKALPADIAAAVLEEASRLAKEIGWLADDVELRLPCRTPSRRPTGRRGPIVQPDANGATERAGRIDADPVTR